MNRILATRDRMGDQLDRSAGSIARHEADHRRAATVWPAAGLVGDLASPAAKGAG